MRDNGRSYEGDISQSLEPKVFKLSYFEYSPMVVIYGTSAICCRSFLNYCQPAEQELQVELEKAVPILITT